MARYRLLLLLGWAALVGGPAAAWARGRTGAELAAYGAPGGGERWLLVLGVAVPSVLAAAVLLLNGALRARARARRGELALGTGDRVFVEASRWAGWACAGLCGFALAGAMAFGGPLGLIGGFGLLLVAFSLVGRGRAAAPDYRPNRGRPEGFEDPRRG